MNHRNIDSTVSFINRISGAQETKEPPDFRGGIIADPMGLGKTLTMIALAATDIETKHPVGKHDSDGTNSDEPHATLIVVPPPCTSQLFLRLRIWTTLTVLQY